jgi:hypothetical protein
MNDSLVQIDAILMKRWADAVAFRNALTDLEGRLAERLEAAAELLRPWLDELGYSFVDVDSKWANIIVARSGWINRKTKKPRVYVAADALLPYGFRKVEEENPSVWIFSWGLDRDDRVAFREQLTERLKGKTGGWLNEHCEREAPAGRYITTHGDRERLELARSPEALAAFAKEILPPILALGDDIEGALRAAS